MNNVSNDKFQFKYENCGISIDSNWHITMFLLVTFYELLW